MKSLFILSCLIFLISSIKEDEKSCDNTMYNETTLDYCKGLKVNAGKQCCVVVKAMLGSNEYYCHEFNEGANEEEINNTVYNDIIKPYEENIFGVLVRARASCSENVKPYSFNKCHPEESQKLNNLETCTNNEKDSQSDYCCLFSATVGENDDQAYFCEELNEAQANNMNKTVNDIDSHYEMNNVKYINCNPKIPEPEPQPDDAFGINYNLLLLVYLFILII